MATPAMTAPKTRRNTISAQERIALREEKRPAVVTVAEKTQGMKTEKTQGMDQRKRILLKKIR